MASTQITISIDMDGTIADLYSNPNWLEQLRAYDPTPYLTAKPLVRMNVLARRLNSLRKRGYRIAIVSWLSKVSTKEYDEAVTAAKREWLTRHLPSVSWDEIVIVPYGTPKENYCHGEKDILFDDEERNRMNWTGMAFDAVDILSVLTQL